MNFNEIWIMSSEGIPFYHKHNDDNNKNIDDDMITSFFSAILCMIRSSSNDEIKAINLKNSKIIIIPNNINSKFFTIVRVPTNQDNKTVKKCVNKINNTFNEKFGKYLINWKGNLNLFCDFENYIKDFL